MIYIVIQNYSDGVEDWNSNKSVCATLENAKARCLKLTAELLPQRGGFGGSTEFSIEGWEMDIDTVERTMVWFYDSSSGEWITSH